METQINTTKYYVWPDGSYIPEDFYSQSLDGHKGDNFQIVDVNHEEVIDVNSYLHQIAA